MVLLTSVPFLSFVGWLADLLAGLGLVALGVTLLAVLLSWRRTGEGVKARLVTLETRLEVVERQLARPAQPVAEAARAPVAKAPPVEAATAPPPPSHPVVSAPRAAMEQASPPPRLPAPPLVPRREERSNALEINLGTRLPVWLGAVALALGGAFLVKYSLDQGWLGPPVRVALAVALGLVAVALGHRLRKVGGILPQGLAAAGIAILFAAFFAAVELYHLLSAGVGFALMTATTGLAVVLSLRLGPLVAALGLLGGLATPALVARGVPPPASLFTYLFLLQVAIFAVSRRRGWPGIPLLAQLGGFLWVGLSFAEFTARGAAPGLYLLATSVLGLAGAVSGHRRAGEDGPAVGGAWTALAYLTALGSFAHLSWVLQAAGYSWREWLFIGLLCAGILLAAWLEKRLVGLAVAAVVAVGAMLLAWAVDLEPAALGRFVVVSGAMAGLAMGFGGSGLWRKAVGSAGGGSLPWSWLASGAGMGLAVLLRLGAEAARSPFPVAAVSLGLAALFAGLVALRERRGDEGRRAVLEGPALTAASLALLAVLWGTHGRWEMLALVALLVALGEAVLRIHTQGLPLFTGLVAVLLGWRSLVATPVLAGEVPLPLLAVDLGVPALALAAVALRLRRQDTREIRGLASLGEHGALFLGVALATLALHRVVRPGADFGWPHSLPYWGALIALWLGLAWGLASSAGRWPRPSLEHGALFTLFLGLPALVLGPVLVDNPTWSHLAVGETPVFNWLLWVYGLPAVLLWALARAELLRRRLPGLARWLPGLALALVFLLVTLEVRQVFRGAFVDGGAATAAERYAVSVVWLALGMTLLAVGISRRTRGLRLAALVVMSLATTKVFLFDTPELSDLYRVLSYLGLGASLFLLAWAYQRFVAREA
jgi:uncharacterized membrane protein